jgi:hypothetical protein
MTKFPGAVGVDIANQIDRVAQELDGWMPPPYHRRPGLAVLRVMSI